ncbi:MAG TPA: PDDEXK nuclease domain-containing protein [Kofleriaceae bacterium]|nr:PDDEXK nuclease domain-containing protein [Kofleriaceae bacterium]
MTKKRARKKAGQPSPRRASAARRQWNALASTGDFAALVERVVAIIEDARARVIRTVNSEMVLSYWHIGREIVEYVQRGSSRAEYGEQVIEDMSARLLARVGRGYSTRNLWYFRDFYLTYRERAPSIRAEVFRTSLVQNSKRLVQNSKPIDAAKILHEAGAEFAQGFSSRLSWTHYRALLKVSDPAARAFYEIEAERENWSTPHLERQIFTALHLRLLKSRDKAGVMELARKGQTVERPSDLIKSPVVLDFLDLPDSEVLRESDLESAILGKLSQFLLELGKGFAFVARQKRLTFEDEEFYVDLVFYNVILKCYLLIDLKLGKLTHQDVGQMDSYVRLFDAQGRTEGDGPTIGLILCAEKNEAIARYSILSEHEQLFAAKYVTYLPSVEELERELERDRRIAEAIVEAIVEPPRSAAPSPRTKKREKRQK